MQCPGGTLSFKQCLGTVRREPDGAVQNTSRRSTNSYTVMWAHDEYHSQACSILPCHLAVLMHQSFPLVAQGNTKWLWKPEDFNINVVLQQLSVFVNLALSEQSNFSSQLQLFFSTFIFRENGQVFFLPQQQLKELSWKKENPIFL